MLDFVNWLNETQKVIEQKKKGEGYEILVRAGKDIDYPDYYKIIITKEN